MKKLLPAAIVFCGLFSAVNSAIAQTWTQLTNAPSTNWNSIAISADGSKLVAVAGTSLNPGPIYTSTDMGVTWLQQTNTQNLGMGLQSVASSADGSILATAPFSGSHNYISTNSGITWMFQTIPNITFIGVSQDGKRLFAAALNSFYVTTNFGANWTTNTVSGAPINTCAVSSDGSRIVAGGISGSVYTSTNYGATWKAGPASGGWPSVASSADGSKFATAPIGSSFAVLTSTNSGGTWTTNAALDNLPIHHLASSADGNKLIVAGGKSGANGGGIYTSTNGGINWITNTVPYTNWISVASSADGNTLVAAVNGGGIWISQTTPTPFLNIVNSNSNFAISWLVPSTNFALQQNLDLTTTNWVTLTNSPTLNLTNLQNQVMLSPSNSSGFFRLITQ
jgi:photosystem II stability/assembly factor-like uncharacterized protein